MLFCFYRFIICEFVSLNCLKRCGRLGNFQGAINALRFFDHKVEGVLSLHKLRVKCIESRTLLQHGCLVLNRLDGQIDTLFLIVTVKGCKEDGVVDLRML